MKRRTFLGLLASPLAWPLPGCGRGDLDWLLPARESPATGDGLGLVTRFVHITDTHVLDEQSPARFAAAGGIIRSAWRPYEAYAAQLLDGIIRTVNRLHAAGRTIDFVLHTGDAVDNAQSNELAWFLAVMNGRAVDPLSGPDDRPAERRPPPELDPHAPFQPQGLYRRDRHGPLPTIPWYGLLGNHDVYAIGVFPIIDAGSRRIAPLPLDWRPGLVLPVALEPTGASAYGRISPADPGPPRLFEPPQPVVPNPDREYFTKPEFLEALAADERSVAAATRAGSPAGDSLITGGHGFPPVEHGFTWYSVTPLPGLRLIGLDTTTPARRFHGGIYVDGALSRAQLDFLVAELDAAAERGETVIVATHHPTPNLVPDSPVLADELRAVLADRPGLVAHLAGHTHVHRVTQRAGYVEIETASTLDPPQEARLLELWRDPRDGRLVLDYETFGHLPADLPPLGDDPLRALRLEAWRLAAGEKPPVATPVAPART